MLSPLTNENPRPQRGLSDLARIRHLARGGAAIQAPEEVWPQSPSSSPSPDCAFPERSHSLRSSVFPHLITDGQVSRRTKEECRTVEEAVGPLSRGSPERAREGH